MCGVCSACAAIRTSCLGRVRTSCLGINPSRRLSIPQISKSTKMDDTKPIDDQTRDELIATVGRLQQKCTALKAESSKYEAMAQKFLRASSAKKRKLKIFDPETTHQRRIALKVSYFGWDYDGLQDNAGLSDSIEKILFLALRHTKLLVADPDDLTYSKCGRTDKGVSAFSQVFCMKLRSRIHVKDENSLNEQGNGSVNPSDDITNHMTVDTTDNDVAPINADSTLTEFDYCQVLNRVLPREIRVLAWSYVNDPEFSARHNCVGRIYKYFFPRGTLDISAMNVAAKKLTGTHDFRNFCKINVRERLVYVRELRDLRIDPYITQGSGDDGEYQMCVATITGTGFLYHQVRYMMSILFLIGQGLETDDIIDDMLDVEKTPRRPQYGLTAEYPLALYDCKFDTLEWNLSAEAQIRIQEDLQKIWLSLAVKTSIARSMMTKFSDDMKLRTDDSEGHKDADGNISRFLMFEKWSRKQYRKILTRQTANSLEEKISHLENKRKRKHESAEETSE